MTPYPRELLPVPDRLTFCTYLTAAARSQDAHATY